MDYEKKYNEAIERMRKMLGPWRELAYNGKSFLQDLESIFPELRESEDEGIRKSLINFLSSFELMRDDATFRKGDFDLDAIKGYISYLEKQKEENHDGKKWIYEDDYHKDMERCFNDGKDEVLENPGKYGLQKEQKPAEKQDYSGLNDPERAILRGFLCAGFENVPVSIIKETAKECIANFPWPTKWSEEDERILKGIIGKIDHDQTYGVSKAEMLSFLKSLRPQPKQEWSEEDENNLNKLLQWDGIPLGLRSWVSGLPEKAGTRPSWKPSEGQKEALKRAIDLLEGEYCDHPEELDSLLNDLNKL